MALSRWLLIFSGVLAGVVVGAAPRAGADPSAVAGTDSTVPYRGTLEASFPWADATTDTLSADAPRLKVEDLLADIGRRQRADQDSLRSFAVTAVVTVVRTPDGGAIDSTGTWSVEQTALRTSRERGKPDRVVRLFERKRKVKNGVAQPAREKAAGKPEWQPQPADLAADLPFAEGSAARYRYALRKSTLVGTSLVHEIDFAPRDHFAALPSGTIWVDIADWAIRRVEARFADSVPYPWILRAVPQYRQRQAPCGGVWFPVSETARVVLRDLPLVDSGGVYDVRVELRDIVINGEPCVEEAPVAVADSIDEAGAFWGAIDGAWDAAVPSTLRAAPSLAPAQMDSLSREGERILAAMPSSPPWRVRLRPMPPVYNRAQGFAPRVGLRFGRVGSQTRLDAQGGIGLTDHRAMWGLGAQAALSSALTFSVVGARETAAFAGDGRAGWRFWSALLWGGDPNHYFDRTAWTAALAWRHDDDAWLKVSAERARELPLAVRTRWNVAGHELSPDGMRAADALDDRAVRVEGGGRVGFVTTHAAAARHWLRARDGVGDERVLDEWRLGMKAQRLDPVGDRWTLRAGGRGFSGVAPAQLKVWGGDWWPDDLRPGDDAGAGGGSLCGWPAGTLAGDHGAWASLAVDLNADPWRSLRVPVLRSLRLQPLVFAEWAGAWGGPAVDGAAMGSRADVGFGFSRRVDLPLVGAGSRLEVRAARAVGEGAEGRDWRVVVGIGR